MRPVAHATILATCAALLAGCGGTTGGDHLAFVAQAAGPADATGQPLVFDTSLDYHVTLERARLHVGALYLNQTQPLSGRQEAGCTLAGVYVGQVLGAVDLDLLSPTPVPFAAPGDGIAVPARTAEVWLTGGAIDAPVDTTPILEVAGSASRGGQAYRFHGALTIGPNRAIPSSDPTLPSANPICRQRIVSPIAVDFTLFAGATLTMRVDPRGMLRTVDFAALPADPMDAGAVAFTNASDNSADISLFNGLRATSAVYGMEVR